MVVIISASDAHNASGSSEIRWNELHCEMLESNEQIENARIKDTQKLLVAFLRVPPNFISSAGSQMHAKQGDKKGHLSLKL